MALDQGSKIFHLKKPESIYSLINRQNKDTEMEQQQKKPVQTISILKEDIKAFLLPF